MGLYISASGILNALQRNDIRANNVANLQTPGYRAQQPTSSESPAGGAYVSSVSSSTASGYIEVTGNPLDLAAQDGFFRVNLPDGSQAYTRDGHFGLNAQGQVVTADGAPIDPLIAVAPGSTNVRASAGGVVSAVPPGGAGPEVAGQLEVFTFPNAGGLEAAGGGLFRATAASGEAQAVGGTPNIVSGALQGSNVDLATEQVNSILDRQALQSNLNVFRTQDEVLGDLLNIVS